MIMSSTTSSASSCSRTSPSNLQRFLQCVTPVVPSRTLPQSCFNCLNSQWQPVGKDTIEYFSLKDLWDCYYEWSAYGVGIPVMLESGGTLMQYYVPYLSAIQIYSNKSVAASRYMCRKHFACYVPNDCVNTQHNGASHKASSCFNCRTQREDSDGVEFESDSWSSDDSGSDNLSRSLSNNSSKAWDAVSEDSSCDQEGSWPTRDMLGYLYLHYTEMSSPYWRIPFMGKITELAKSYPALMTLKSVDLSPATWMAVAWYPIYPIPSRKNEKDLAACFLTYHTLSSSFQDCTMEDGGDNDIAEDMCCFSDGGGGIEEEIYEKRKKSGCASLPPFGLATYKMQGDIWLNSESRDDERMCYLYSAADSWLKQLNAHHHDFNFFTFRSTSL